MYFFSNTLQNKDIVTVNISDDKIFIVHYMDIWLLTMFPPSK